MTWIDIVYDFVDKLRELELTGEKREVQKLAEFEKCHRPENIDRALKFERDLLVAARDDFESISPLEFTDLSSTWSGVSLSSRPRAYGLRKNNQISHLGPHNGQYR